MNYMDRRGSGFDKIINWTNRLFNDGKNHVEFYATPTHFSVIIYNANYVNDKVNGTKNDTKNDTKSGTKNGANNYELNSIEKEVYNIMKMKANVTINEIVEKTGKSQRTIKRVVANLKSYGIIKRSGSNKGGKWDVL